MTRFFTIAAILLLTCCNSREEEKLFTLLSETETGIGFSNDLVSSDEMNILEYLYFYNGGGVAVGDINNDGLVDIYFTSNQGENKLYLNKGNFEFEDITVQSGTTGDGGWSTGVTMADVNGDGLLDIYVCQVGDYKGLEGKNKLYINNGDLTFTESGAEYGVDFSGFSTHALFFDYDNDGDLDLYLLNHSIKKPEVFSHADTKFGDHDKKGGDKLFKNLLSEGETGMVEVTQEAGIFSSSLGFGLGVAAADINGNGWMDLYVSNDFTEDDYLYINQGDGTFKESLSEFISHTSRYSMGLDINDINNDGLPDIFTTDMLPEDPEIWMKSVGEDKQEVYTVKKNMGYGDQYVRNHLLLNLGNGRFSDIALLTQTYATDWSWSPLFFDMDNDGKKDLHITNGIVNRPNDLDFIQYSQSHHPGLTPKEIQRKQIEMMPTLKLPNYTFQNRGSMEWTNVSEDWGLNQASYSNGSAYADLNNDGALDLIINNIDQKAFIYRNNSLEINGNHFIQIDLKGKAYNTFGIGAQVLVYRGDEILHQTLGTSRGFQSGSSTTLTFGLGKAEVIDSLTVIWPGGERENFSAEVNTRLLLEQGKGRASQRPNEEDLKPLYFEDRFDWSHAENVDYDDTRKEYLIPRKYSTEGPALAVGDVDGDGLEDVYFGGARNQSGALYLQQKDGSFKFQINDDFEKLKMSEEVDAVLVDLNNNGHLDLYVVSGGNEFPEGHLFNFDKVFLNDGKGNFRFSPNALPPLSTNGKVVRAADFNGDGFMDLFVGSNISHGNYGVAPESYLLLNRGNATFTKATDRFAPDLARIGMVNDAQWHDLNGNGAPDLILAGEWMPIVIFENDGKGNLSKGNYPELEKRTGWWNSLLVQDITGDGNPEIVAGNLGLNSKLKASEEKPLFLYLGDYDQNGQLDPILFHHMGEALVPFASRDDLIKQIPGLKGKHASYADYAKSRTPKEVLGVETATEKILETVELSSGVFSWSGKDFKFTAFAPEAQLSPIKGFVFMVEEQLLLSAGNFYGFRTDLGKASSLPFLAQYFDGSNLYPTSLLRSIPQGDYRQVKAITIKDGKYFIAVRNNGSPVLFEIEMDRTPLPVKALANLDEK
jgi:enediyne biosynthesis protein E4